MADSPAETRISGSLDGGDDHLRERTPDGALYWDEGNFRSEMERLFFRNWLNVARDEDLSGPGDFLTRTVGGESLLVARDDRGGIGAFYNLCRHRGTRVVTEEVGRGARAFTCPYHGWNYALDGSLRGAPRTAGLEEFRKEEYGLYPLRVDRWGGFVWVNFDRSAPPFSQAYGRFVERMGRFPIASLRLGARKTYRVEANWKIIVENYSECYHCAPVHPSLNRITPYSTGENEAYFTRGEVRSKFAGGFMTFAQDFTSMTRSGHTARPPIDGMTADDRGRIYYYTLFPNTLFSLHPDYLMIHRAWPIDPSHTRVDNEFYFDPAAISAPGFDPSDATEIWDEVNRQDWAVCELAQKGSGSRAWHGGRYSEQESLVADFDRYFQDEMQRPR